LQTIPKTHQKHSHPSDSEEELTKNQAENGQNRRKKIKNTFEEKSPKTQETDVFALLNPDTNSTKTSANMTRTNTQKKNHKKTPYEAPSGDKNTKKNEKSEENNKNKQISQTASGSHDFSRDVNTSLNTNNNNTNSNKTQEEAAPTSTVNEIDIPDAEQAATNNWKTIELTQRHSLFINANHSQGENLLEKKKYLESTLMACHSLLGSSTKKGHDDMMYIKIDFGENEDKLTACEILDNKEIPYLTSIKGKGKDTAALLSDHPDRGNELVVKDIPLEIKKDNVERKFSYYGKIERIILKVNFGWQTVHIYFESPDAITDNFQNKWSTTLKKDSVRVYLAKDFDAETSRRQLYTLKLCNLPRGTTAFDIQDYIKDVKGKTCFIPCSRGKYERV